MQTGVVLTSTICVMRDKVFDALAERDRRELLVELLDTESHDVSTVSGVPWEIEESDEEMIRKCHVHLPKLADYGFIEWNREEDVVTRGPRFDELQPLLEHVIDQRDELLVESS